MDSIYQRRIKRALDFGLSATAIIVLSPVLTIVALAIKMGDRGPALFRQNRIGRNGEEFTIFKFRSMRVGIGDIPSGDLQQHVVTRPGRVIRRTNIDELPQLFNIVRGDMSIVGPRPCLTTQTDVISMRRANGALALRPGLTGWAQVNSFDGMGADVKSRFDGEYVELVSLRADLRIIARTATYLLQPPPKY